MTSSARGNQSRKKGETLLRYPITSVVGCCANAERAKDYRRAKSRNELAPFHIAARLWIIHRWDASKIADCHTFGRKKWIVQVGAAFERAKVAISKSARPMSGLGLGRVKTRSRNERAEFPSLYQQRTAFLSAKCRLPTAWKCAAEEIILLFIGEPDFSRGQGHSRRFGGVSPISGCLLRADVAAGCAIGSSGQ
jgi:hypothetical protein